MRPPQYSWNRSSRSSIRPTATSATACASSGSRLPTSTSMALCSSTPDALFTECSKGGASPEMVAWNFPSQRTWSFSFSFPSHS